jgi:hypothetical protein
LSRQRRSKRSWTEAIAVTARALPVRVASLATYNPAGDPTERGARFTLDVGLAIADAVTGKR